MALKVAAVGNRLTRTATGLTGYPQTICFWLKSEVDTNTAANLYMQVNTGTNDYNTFYSPTSNGTTFVWELSNGDASVNTTTPVIGTWYFMAFSRLGIGSNQMSFYSRTQLDVAFNSLTETQTQPNYTPNLEVIFQNYQTFSATDFFSGSIANIKIWTAQLSSAELWVESQTLAPVITANLHSWHPMNGALVADCALDSSANARHFTVVGAGMTVVANPTILDVVPANPFTLPKKKLIRPRLFSPGLGR